MFPSFIVIGSAKCGTTSVCSLLAGHPQVFMSDPKEIHYFGRTDAHKTLQWYESFFKGAEDKPAVGEGSTSYTHPDLIGACATEIAEYIPECRLIYMVRNPLERLESAWKMREHEGWAAGPINEAVARQETLITHGLYWKNLNVYRQHFRDEQILIVFLEDFARDPQRELDRCFRHIGVEPGVDATGPARNRSSDFRKDGAIAKIMRGTRFFDGVKNALPRWAVDAAKSVLTSREDLTIRWDPEVRRGVIARFADDSRRLLEFCDKPPDFWTYDD